VKGTGTPPWVILPLTVIQSRSLRRRSFPDFGFRAATQSNSRLVPEYRAREKADGTYASQLLESKGCMSVISRKRVSPKKICRKHLTKGS
jgi:hypothetical protein